MRSIYKHLALVLALAVMGIHLALAAAPPGKSVTPSLVLQGGSASAAKWLAPSTLPYKVHVFVPKAGTEANSIYRVYPNGKRPGSTSCLSTDAKYPCYEAAIDQTQHQASWVQLTLNGDPGTQWNFVRAKG